MDVVVARLGRPQGLRGEVTVEVRTDEPELRLAVGSVLLTRGADLGAAPVGVPATLTVASSRLQNGRLMLGFEGVDDRTAAETLRDVLVAVEVDPEARPEDPEEFYDHQLVGLTATTVAGDALGAVADVLHLPSQDVLVVRDANGREVLVPFVTAIVPTVDLAARSLTVDPPPGLFEGGSEPAEPAAP